MSEFFVKEFALLRDLIELSFLGERVIPKYFVIVDMIVREKKKPNLCLSSLVAFLQPV